MKRWLLILSLAGVTLLLLLWRPHPQPDETVALNETRSSVAPPGVALRRTRARQLPTGTNATSGPLWAAVESRDPAQFAANLRELGCPEQTIRDLITFRLCREYRDRVLALKTERTLAWDYTRSTFNNDATLQREQEIELENALDRDLEALFGISAMKLKVSVFGLPKPSDYPEFLPLETRAKERDLDLRYRRLGQDVRQRLLAREGNDAFQAGLAELDAQKQAELATLLTPQELEMHKLHLSPAAQYVRHSLPEAKSEAEFRIMVRAAEEVGLKPPWMKKTSPRTILRRYGIESLLDTGEEEERNPVDLQGQLHARLTELLGEQRASELVPPSPAPRTSPR